MKYTQLIAKRDTISTLNRKGDSPAILATAHGCALSTISRSKEGVTAAFRFIGMDWKLTGGRGVVGIRRRAASGARAHLPLLHGVVAKDRAEDHKRNSGEWSDEEADHQETERRGCS